jgi:opacity protein-like surface antigen
MKQLCAILVLAVIFISPSLAASVHAQESAPEPKTTAPKAGESPSAAPESKAGREYSGMYSFLKDGEFVQITVEDEGRVTGFVSRYGDGDSDKDAFLDQYLHSGKLDGNKLTFTTETVQGIWFEFKGAVDRGEGKNPGDEAYYVLKGTLTDNTRDAEKKVTSHSRDVLFKLFPAEASPKN